MDIYRGLGELGVCGIVLPEKYGGAGLGYSELIVVLEEIAKFSASYAVTLSVSTMVQSMIDTYGSEEQKQKYLPELTSGKEIGAFSLSEAGSGSDAASLRTKATLKGEDYILNGSKMWVTSGGVAKTYVVMARSGADGPKGVSSFIVQNGQSGFEFGKLESKMGLKASPTRELIFENCKIPKSNILGSQGLGFNIAMSALDRGRFTIASIATGLAKRSLDEAVKYSLTRKQFNQPIFEFQGLQFMMADMACEITASELLVQKAATNFDAGINDQKIAAMAKLKATDTAMSVTTDAVQIMGGVGYTSEFPLERFMRDAKVLQIVEGTNQIQRVVISRMLKKEYS